MRGSTSGPLPVDTDADLRRARRAFVRTHHPDRGGDPDAFVAGLPSFDRLQAPPEQAGRQAGPVQPRRGAAVTVLRRPRGAAAWLRHLGTLTAASLGNRKARPSRVR